MDEQRIIEIETKITYQDQLLQEHNRTIYEQHKQLERLERMCLKLIDQLKGMTNAEPMLKPEDEKPPHY